MSEVEKQFFDTFGIEKKCTNKKHLVTCNLPGCEAYCKQCAIKYESYPDITAEKLLEMICIYAQREVFCFPVVPNDEETWTISLIKENIIEQLMYLGKYSDDKEFVKHQIQQLFAEEE